MQRLKSRPESVGAGFCSGPKKLGDPASEVNRKVFGRRPGSGGTNFQNWQAKESHLASKHALSAYMFKFHPFLHFCPPHFWRLRHAFPFCPVSYGLVIEWQCYAVFTRISNSIRIRISLMRFRNVFLSERTFECELQRASNRVYSTSELC